jgi:hypothetical protein
MRRNEGTFPRAMTAMVNMLSASVAHAAATANTNARSQNFTRGKSMKTFSCSFFALIALAAGIAPAYATTVKTPENGAQVTSPFNLVASTQTCDSKPAVSMGYSIDHGATTVVPISFSAMVSASEGNHILHVKCWGKKVHAALLLSITVGSGDPSTTATPTFSPSTGSYSSAVSLTLSATTAGATIYYTTDGTAPSSSSTQYSGLITVDDTEVIEAIAVAPGYTASALVTANYIIDPSGSGPVIPSNALSITEVQLQPDWKVNHDPATKGSSEGTMTLVTDPTLSGKAAKFDSTFTDWGGEIYSKSYGKDPDSMNFLYDAEVWIESGSKIGNLEMDNNQVIANGDTIIYAFQCDGDHGTWDYSSNAGTREHTQVKWIHSSQACNPANWTPNEWHHIQISYSRDNDGNVIYHSVWFDGVEGPINETVNSDFALGWAHGDLMTNFQIDGLAGSGSSKLYLDDLTIYRW